MTTSTASTQTRAQELVRLQRRYAVPRRFMRDILLRQIGLKLLVKARIAGVEHIPASGPTLLIMNHIAAIDPFIVVAAVTPRFVVPMSKIENYRNPVVGLMARSWGAYPVRRGEVDRQALDNTVALLREEYPVLIAPEGTRQPALSEAKNGMSYVALKANATIVPVGLDGTDQFPRSLKRLSRARVTVQFGPAFRLRSGEGSRVPRDVLHQMSQEIMVQLALLLPENRRGAYSDLSRKTTQYLEFAE